MRIFINIEENDSTASVAVQGMFGYWDKYGIGTDVLNRGHIFQYQFLSRFL